MGSFIIKVTSGSNVGTIENQIDVGFRYTDKLNDINEAELKISGLGAVKRGLLTMGAEVEISRNGTLEFKGLLDSIDTLDAGSVNVHISGKEIRLAQEKGAYVNSPWTSTASATINNAIIAESSYFTAGTVEAGVSLDFRLDVAQSLWNGLGNLSTKTGQDIQLDYANDEIDILDNRGSATSVATLNDGIHINNIRVSTSYPQGNNVKVYGKGDGDNQIVSDNAQGQDATSKATYGEIKQVIIDRSIMSVSEANSRANIEVPKIKDPIKVYDCNVINPGATMTTGDIITLNSQDKDLTNEEVRVVGIERGVIDDKEYMSIQVTNAAFSQIVKTANQQLGKIHKDSIDSNSYMQGSGNLSQWKGLINGNNSAGLRFTFNIGDDFEDESGNLQINSLTVDYDIDEYRRGVGTAVESNKEPDIASGTYSGQDNESLEVDDDTDFNNSIVFADSWTGYKTWSDIPEHGEAIIFHVHVWVVDWPTPTSATSAYTRIYHIDQGDYYPSTTGLRLLRGLTAEDTDNDTHNHTINMNTHNHDAVSDYQFLLSSDGCNNWTHCSTVTEDETHNHTSQNDTHDHVAYKQLNGTASIYIPIDPYLQDFVVQLDHTGSGNATAGVFFAYYVVSQHNHGNGDYKTDLHLHDVSVGDDVSDAGSINATEVNIYLDFWNGSAWINKHSILGTGETLETDVDMSDGGTYPDAKGYWRVRILTDNADPDLIQGIINVRHGMDN